MIKGSTQEENIIFVNIYTPNIKAHKYTKNILTEIKGKIDSNTIIIGDVNTSLTSMDRYPGRKLITKH